MKYTKQRLNDSTAHGYCIRDRIHSAGRRALAGVLLRREQRPRPPALRRRPPGAPLDPGHPRLFRAPPSCIPTVIFQNPLFDTKASIVSIQSCRIAGV